MNYLILQIHQLLKMSLHFVYPDIMYKLGDYYENIEKDYDLMEKYYSMAFNK